MRWLRLRRVYVARMRVSRREIGIAVALTIAAFVSVIAAVTGVAVSTRTNTAETKQIDFISPINRKARIDNVAAPTPTTRENVHPASSRSDTGPAKTTMNEQ